MIQTPELRQTGIGGSDIAAIAGLSKWSTPYDIYLQKTDPPSEEPRDVFYWGHVLESVVADEYAKRTNRKIRISNKTYRDKKQPYLMAHVDRLVKNEKRILECKTTRFADKEDWGEAGSDIVPTSYMLQVQHYLEILNFDVADLAVLIGGNDYRIYTINREKEIGKMIRKIAADFWKRVQDRNPPDPLTMSDLAKRFPRDSGLSVVASPDIIDTINRLKEIKIEVDRLEDEEKVLRQAVALEMGENAYLVNASGKEIASWKTQVQNRIDSDILKKEYPNIYKACLKSSSFRKFIIKKEKPE